MDQRGPYAVVIAGIDMPGMNGIQLLSLISEKAPETVRVMLTGNSGSQTAIEAVNKGHVFPFLTKPCAPDWLTSVVRAAIKQNELVTAEKELLQSTLHGSIKVLTDIMALMDPEACGRGEKVRDDLHQLAGQLKVTDFGELDLAAMLASIGEVAVPRALLKKARSDRADTLTGQERDILNRIPLVGADLLKQIPRLKNVARIIRYQNKNFDGSGIPVDAVSRHEIPLGARILRVLTELVELEAKEMPTFRAIETLQRWPNLYDPEIVGAAAACLIKTSSTQKGGIAASELRVGHVLLSDIVSKDGVLIVSSGNKISSIILEKIKNFVDLGGVQEPIFIKQVE
ncbi:MAG: response regulator [Verrucomicrobia bacterium]|nr:response regulator [Verrucomicrobiota bacterium]